jgi:hypothetical protein
MKPLSFLIAVAFTATAGCAGAEGNTEGEGEAAPAADSILIQGTPAGGLEDWARDIQEGLRELPAEVGRDAQAAQREALDLYVSRQEYIELYWGPSGRLLPEGGTGLGQAVLDAETGFHELLTLLTASPVDSARVSERVDTVTARLNRVLETARTLNVTMIPPGNPPATNE